MNFEQDRKPNQEPDGESATHQLCEEARQHLSANQYEKAMTKLTTAIKQDRDCSEAYDLRQYLYLVGQDWAAQVSDLTELIRLRPRNPIAYTQRAMAYTHLRQYERVILDCNKTLELDSACADAYFHRGYALGMLGRAADARADSRRWLLLVSDPEQQAASDQTELIVSLLKRGDNSLQAGHPEDAVQAYSAVLLEDPDHIEARFLRGRTYAKLCRFEEASSDLLEAWRRKEEHDRIGRGYLVAIEGSKREQLWATFPDDFRGKCDAIALAQELITNPTPIEELRTWIGDFERTKIYQLEGHEIEVIDYIWSDEHKAHPKTVVRMLRPDSDPNQD